MSTEQLIGEGVNVTVDDDTLVIAIDLSETIGMSASGKNMRFATSNGNASLVHKGKIIKLGLNCFRVPSKVELAKYRKELLDAEEEAAADG